MPGFARAVAVIVIVSFSPSSAPIYVAHVPAASAGTASVALSAGAAGQCAPSSVQTSAPARRKLPVTSAASIVSFGMRTTPVAQS